jgi:hypothetical protein
MMVVNPLCIAIKQFAYLFPELCSKTVLLVYATDDPTKQIPDEEQIQELAARHFSKLSLLSWTLTQKNSSIPG